MARPKVLSDDVVRVEVAIPWEEDAELNAVAEAAGVSKAALIRTFLTYGLRAYTNAWLATTPPLTASQARRRKP